MICIENGSEDTAEVYSEMQLRYEYGGSAQASGEEIQLSQYQ
jgi:hypothetical protein